MLKISKSIENGKACFALEGRLDTATSPELDTALRGSLDGVTELVLDFKALDYISSAGLRVLLSAQKMMSGKGGMKLIHVNEMILEIFDATGFSDVLTVQ